MSEKNNSIQMFEDRQIRTAWNAEQEEWYFSVTDVIAVLTDSADPKQYIKKMRSRDSELDARWGTICTLTSMVASDGKKYRTNAATMEGIFRIIQSVTSPKVEPLKAWLAKVGSERIEETIDPEKAIDRAFATYLKKGYDEDWINQRLLTIRVRKELTDEWQKRGVQEGKEFAILTDEINIEWGKPGSAANQDGLCRFARDEKSRTFSSNSKSSHILRTSSRSRRLILSSIVSFAVWLKWTRTI